MTRLRLSCLESHVTTCFELISLALRAPISSSRTYYADTLASKAVAHASSICALLASIRSGQEPDHWGICALTRTLIETRNVFAYVTEFRISSDERNLRVDLLSLNEQNDLGRINNALGLASSGSSWIERLTSESAQDSLMRNPVFLSLEQKEQTRLLKGRTPLLLARCKTPGPLSQSDESALYNLFSHFVHSFGLSNSGKGRSTPAGTNNVLFLATEAAILYLSDVGIRYRSVRARIMGERGADLARRLQGDRSDEVLQQWKERFRSEGHPFDF